MKVNVFITLLAYCFCLCVGPLVLGDDQVEPVTSEDVAEEVSHESYWPYPDPDAGYVTDLAGLLTNEQEEQIEVWLWQTESRTNVEVVVVTIGSIQDYLGTANESIESFARGLFDAYGIGNLPENNGVLLVVAKNDRKARIELGAGYGRARDGDANRIMQDQIVPRFKQNRYADGITDGVRTILHEFAGVRVGVPWAMVLAGILIIVLIPLSYSLFKNGKRGWGWACVGVIISIIVWLLLMLDHLAAHMPEGNSSSWDSGGFGGGFGGGSSGGGGATGSW